MSARALWTGKYVAMRLMISAGKLSSLVEAECEKDMVVLNEAVKWYCLIMR
jgi:hypothetical protein